VYLLYSCLAIFVFLLNDISQSYQVADCLLLYEVTKHQVLLETEAEQTFFDCDH